MSAGDHGAEPLPETHRVLKSRAAAHGRRTEAEARSILDEAVSVTAGNGLGTRIARVAAGVGGFDLEIERSTSISAPPDFS